MPEPAVSVIIPTMNEEQSIGTVLDEIHEAFRGKRWDYEIIVVDTNSKDRTVDIAKSKGAMVVNESRRGYGRAYKTGFELARGKFIATLDADCTYPASEIPRMLEILESENLDFITGERMTTLSRSSMRLAHRVGNRLLNLTTRILFSIRLKDSQSGMWVFRKSILQEVRVESDGMPFSEELKIRVLKRGFRFREVPIEYRPRLGDQKLRSWSDGWSNFKFLFRLRFGRNPARLA